MHNLRNARSGTPMLFKLKQSNKTSRNKLENLNLKTFLSRTWSKAKLLEGVKLFQKLYLAWIGHVMKVSSFSGAHSRRRRTFVCWSRLNFLALLALWSFCPFPFILKQTTIILISHSWAKAKNLKDQTWFHLIRENLFFLKTQSRLLFPQKENSFLSSNSFRPISRRFN